VTRPITRRKEDPPEGPTCLLTLQAFSTPIYHRPRIYMADNKTAAIRKQLKIKTGVVKRWVQRRSDNTIPLLKSFHLRFSVHVPPFILFPIALYPLSKIHVDCHDRVRCRVSRGHDVRRLSKERTLYAKENKDQKLKVDKLVADNGDNSDEWDIKNGVRSVHALSLLDPCRKHRKE